MIHTMTNCRLCGADAEPAFAATVLSKYRVEYQHCPSCDYLQSQSPYWLQEAYARPITLQDTGVLQRNLSLSRALALTLYESGLRDGPFLDYAGGYGVMTRLMRDLGFDYYWNDPYTQNLFAVGFEAQLEGRYEAISAFETCEHLTDPMGEIGLLVRHTDTFVFSTELRPVMLPGTDWPYYGFGHGQHIGFFSRASLEFIAARLGMRLLSDGSLFHVLTRSSGLELPRFKGIKARIRMRSLHRRMHSLTARDSARFE